MAFRLSSWALIWNLIVAGSLHGDVQQPVLLPAATAWLHEARRDGPTTATACSGNPLDGRICETKSPLQKPCQAGPWLLYTYLLVHRRRRRVFHVEFPNTHFAFFHASRQYISNLWWNSQRGTVFFCTEFFLHVSTGWLRFVGEFVWPVIYPTFLSSHFISCPYLYRLHDGQFIKVCRIFVWPWNFQSL